MEKWLSTWSIGQQGKLNDFENIKEAGFEGVEILTEQLRAIEYLQYAKRSGLKVSIHLPFHDLNLATPDPFIYERVSSVLSKWIELIAEYGGYHATLHGGYAWSSEERYDSLLRVKERLVILGEKANQLGIELAFENLIPDKLNYCHHIASNVEEWISLINETSVKACLDTGHLACMGGNMEETIERLGNSLVAIHLSDNDRNSDLHLLPGEGGDITKGLFHFLEKSSFKGPIVYEINPYKYSLEDIFTHLISLKQKR
ncbi:sugar phosphate isomerase/epimerase family protein [Cytobacillus praedii]|uniref:sugar phosphate isomerase/epimerase family protein n=1 Tax=Cytobacillus praedii TaxID=1742358 RepID=UPI003AF66C00